MKWHYNAEKEVHYRDDFVMVQQESTGDWSVTWPHKPGAVVGPQATAELAMKVADMALKECLPQGWVKVTSTAEDPQRRAPGYYRDDGWEIPGLDGTQGFCPLADEARGLEPNSYRAIEGSPWAAMARIELSFPQGSFPWVPKARPWPGMHPGQVWTTAKAAEDPESGERYLVTYTDASGRAWSGGLRLDHATRLRLIRGQGAPWDPATDEGPDV